MVVWLFLGVPWVCLLFVIVVFPDHTQLLFLGSEYPLYLLYMNHKTGDLKTWLTSLDSKWEWAGNAPDQMEFDHEIISQLLSKIAIIVYLF